jgi:ribosomal protein S18 acetylase RimI-like enzyme
MTEALIRRAKQADAATLGEIGRRTFAETFGHLYPPEDLADYLATGYADDKVAAELADPRMAHWLVEQDGAVIGHCSAGPCGLPHPDVTADDGELKRIYLLKGRQGGGVGTRLLETALAWLEKDGPRTLWIGVWSENHGARRLYERYGFEIAGEYEFVVGNTRDHEFILKRGRRDP